MYKLFLAIIIVSFSITPILAKKTSSSVYSDLFFDEAIRVYKNNDIKKAISLTKRALEVDPNDVSIQLVLGQMHLEALNYDLAINTFKEVVEEFPKDAYPRLLLGIAYEKNNQLADALKQYKLARSFEDENVLLETLIGNVCFLQADYDCVINSFDKVVVSYPSYLPAKLLLATSYHYLKKYTLAKQYYQDVLESMPGDYTIWYNLAKVQIALNELENAKLSLNQALLINNSAIELYLDRAHINYKLSNLTEADNDYLLALQLEPTNPSVSIEYAHFLFETASYDKAIKQYQRALALQPHDLNVLLNLAYLFQLTNEYYQSIDTWNAALNIDPDNDVALFNLAKIYQDGKDYTKAIEYYKRLISVDNGESVDAKINLALCLKLNKNYSEAKSVFVSILKLDEYNPNLLYAYGDLLLETGDYKDAIGYFKESINNGFEDVGLVYKATVKAYEQLNDTKNLKSTYSKWLELDKGNISVRLEYAKLLAKLGETQNAIEQYRVAAALDNTSDSRYKLAQFLIEQGDYYGAIGQLHEFLKIKTNDLNALILLANAFKELGIKEQAINTYKKIISIQVDNHLAYFNLGLLSQREDKISEARNFFLKSIELNEAYAPAYYALGLTYLSEDNPDEPRAKQYLEQYLQLAPEGEYKDKTKLLLQDLQSKSITLNSRA